MTKLTDEADAALYTWINNQNIPEVVIGKALTRHLMEVTFLEGFLIGMAHAGIFDTEENRNEYLRKKKETP